MYLWEKLGNADDEVEDTVWDEIRIRNFKCSVILVYAHFIFKKFTKQFPLMIFI